MDLLPHVKYEVEKTFKIVGTYKGQVEDIETDIESIGEAECLLVEYTMAFGSDWNLSIEKE